MDIKEEWNLFVAHLRTLGVIKIGRNTLDVITNLVREASCSLGYNDIELMWETWQAAKASVPEGFVLVEINDLTTVLSNCSDAMMDESTSFVYDETGEPSTWFDHHVVAEGNLLLAIGKAQEPSND